MPITQSRSDRFNCLGFSGRRSDVTLSILSYGLGQIAIADLVISIFEIVKIANLVLAYQFSGLVHFHTSRERPNPNPNPNSNPKNHSREVRNWTRPSIYSLPVYGQIADLTITDSPSTAADRQQRQRHIATGRHTKFAFKCSNICIN